MATLTADSIENVLQIVSDLRGESSTNTDATRIRAVSRAERDFAARKFWRYHLLSDQSLGTGDGTTTAFTIGSSTYPYRPKGLFEVFVGDPIEENRYDLVDYEAFKERYNANNADKMAYAYYDAANDYWKVKINPAPESGAAVTASYFYTPPKRTSSSDMVICPNMDILARLTLAYLFESEEENDKRDANFQLAEQLIQEASGTEEAPSENQLYTVTAIENSGRNRGVGTY